MKRSIAVILISLLVLIGLAAPLTGCGSEPDEAEAAETQTATVQRGDLAVEIAAAGNLALSTTEDLAFDLFYPEGTVEEVLVEEGDVVTEGQVLASLDTEEWEDNLEELRDRLTAAGRTLTARERALVQAERQAIALERALADKEDDVVEARRQVTAKEVAVSQAQLAFDTAEYNLSEINDVKEAQENVDDAEDALRLVNMVLRGELGGGLQGDFAYWSQLKTQAEEELAEAEEELQEILEDISISVSRDVALEVAEKQVQVKQKQLALEDAQIAVVEAEKAVDDAGFALEEAQLDVEEGQHDVEDARLDIADASKALRGAQEKLEEANGKSPHIVAPFDGFITRVNVEGGDEVMTDAVAVQLADPNKFEAAILVSEMDILQVEEGGEAWVQVDAISGLTLPATVTHISPTATIQSGVVNYSVKVEVGSLEEMMQERQAGRRAAALTEDYELREGLTVTVTIVVEERTDVLLVPNAAIASQAGRTYVQVVSPDDTTEQRAIQTGISNWQFTEVTEGLAEGEQIIVPEGTATTTSRQGPGGGVFFHGMGGPR